MRRIINNVNADDINNQILLCVLEKLSLKLLEDSNNHNENESTYMFHHIASIIDSILRFPGDKYVDKFWFDTKMQLYSGYIPDFLVQYTNRKRTKVYDVLVAEVKKPSNGGSYQLESDGVKLLKEMKLILDQFVDNSVENPFSLGILSKDFKVSIKEMRLEAPGCYIVRTLFEFDLARGPNDLFSLVVVVENLLAMKDKVDYLLYQLKSEVKHEVEEKKYVRPTFNPPQKLPYIDPKGKKRRRQE